MRIQNIAVPLPYKKQATGKTSNPLDSVFANAINNSSESRHNVLGTDIVPTYQISQEQVEELKKRYNLEDISKEDFHKLMSELKELGIVSEQDSQFFSETSSGGVEYTHRPIVLGLFKKETTEQFFNFKGFEQGNLFDWISKIRKQNESAIEWLSNGESSLNDKMQDFRNSTQLERYNQDIDRLLTVLNSLI